MDTIIRLHLILTLLCHLCEICSVVDFNKVTLEAEKILITEHVARTLRDYIDNFFGCESCRQNFVATFDSCGHDRCDRLKDEFSEKEMDWVQLPLWLFETHNAVNVRLLKERASREDRNVSPDEIASVQWPPRRECSACWMNDDEWDEDIVLKYLRLEYGQRDAFSADLRQSILSLQKTEQMDENNRGKFFPRFVPQLFIALTSMLAFGFSKRRLQKSADSDPCHLVPDMLDEIRAIANYGKLRMEPDIMDEIRAIAKYGTIRKVKRRGASTKELLPPDLLIEQNKVRQKKKMA